MTIMNMFPKWILIITAIFVSVCILIIIPPFFRFQGDRTKILMCGRSTMMLWFKHWNWPYPLRIKTTYRAWPIPYYEYTHGNLYLEYLSLPSPISSEQNDSFGKDMLKSFNEGLIKKRYDVVFFKFCFVDFMVEENEKEKRLKDLTNIIQEVYDITSKQKMKLILGNALPLPEPNNPTLSLQMQYNDWLTRFASEHNDILIFDFFSPLTLKDGRMNMALARSSGDHHPGERAFSLLDKIFFEQIENWLAQ